MLQNALVQAERKTREMDTENSKDFSFFAEVSFRILSTLYANAAKEGYVFSHNDLLTKSVIMQEAPDQTTEAVIVDWEYSGRANWSTDLAKLCVNLEPIDVEQVGSAYIDKRFGDSVPENTNENSMKIELELNRFLHSFLELQWKYSSKDGLVPEKFDDWVAKLQSQLFYIYPKTIPFDTFFLAQEVYKSYLDFAKKPRKVFFSQPEKIEQQGLPLAIDDKKLGAATEPSKSSIPPEK